MHHDMCFLNLSQKTFSLCYYLKTLWCVPTRCTLQMISNISTKIVHMRLSSSTESTILLAQLCFFFFLLIRMANSLCKSFKTYTLYFNFSFFLLFFFSFLFSFSSSFLFFFSYGNYHLQIFLQEYVSDCRGKHEIPCTGSRLLVHTHIFEKKYGG